MSRTRRSLVVGYDGFSRNCALFSVYFGNILRYDLAHGVVERHAQHIDEQVDGVSRHSAKRVGGRCPACHAVASVRTIVLRIEVWRVDTSATGWL